MKSEDKLEMYEKILDKVIHDYRDVLDDIYENATLQEQRMWHFGGKDQELAEILEKYMDMKNSKE